MSLRPAWTSGLRIREYNPDGVAPSRPIHPEEWKMHEARIRALHAEKYTRAKVLEELKADCGCTPHCSFSPSSSQYSAQLKIWRLRTYKTKGVVLKNSDCRKLNMLPQSSVEIPWSTPWAVHPKPDAVPLSETNPKQVERAPGLRPSSVRHRPLRLGVAGVFGHQKQAATEIMCPTSSPVNKASTVTIEVNENENLKAWMQPCQSTRSPRGGQTLYPHFPTSENLQDAVRRVVDALCWVIADAELEEFLDNLTDTELDGLLTDCVKLNEARIAALAKRNGKLLRVGEFFGQPPTRLVEIRDALERRARSLYLSNPYATPIDSDRSITALTVSSFEQSPVLEYSDENEKRGFVRICDEDTEMQQDFKVLEITDDVHGSKYSFGAFENGSLSCSACVVIPKIEYEVSQDALRLWSQVNSRHYRPKALDEIGQLAGFFFAARSYADAFDLYYIIWTESTASPLAKFTAAINCARTSATPQQDSCVEGVLHDFLSTYSKRPLNTGSRNLLRESVAHAFLSDLYQKQSNKTNAEAHGTKALLDLDVHKINIIKTSFHNYLHVIAVLESQIAERQRMVSQAIGYNASPMSAEYTPKIFATEVEKYATFEDLLTWCTMTIHENARGLDAFQSVLPKQLAEQRGFICRILHCYFIERWLREQNLSRTARKYIPGEPLAQFQDVSIPEALSAMAVFIVHDWPDRDPFALFRTRLPPGLLSSALLKNTRGLMRFEPIDLNHRTFPRAYSSLMAPSREVRGQAFDGKARGMLSQFMVNIASINLVNRYSPSRVFGSHKSLVPDPDLFREFEIRSASWSTRLYSPQSSVSSGLNSFRATATKTRMNSVLSLAKRRNDNLMDAMSIVSSHSSWSFGAVTGMRCTSSALSDADIIDHEAETIQEEPQDHEMVDD